MRDESPNILILLRLALTRARQTGHGCEPGGAKTKRADRSPSYPPVRKRRDPGQAPPCQPKPRRTQSNHTAHSHPMP